MDSTRRPGLRSGILLFTLLALACGDSASLKQPGAWIRSALGVPSVTSFTPETGGVNTTVTVTGSNFTGATVVRFGGTASSVFTVVSDTELTARVPTGAATGPITVGHPSEGSGSSSTDFVVPVSSPPVVGSFSPRFGPPGTTVTVEGQGLEGATVAFGGVAGSVTSSSETQVVVTVPAGARSGPLTVGNGSGSTQTIEPFTVSPGAAPTVSSLSPASGGPNTFVSITGTELNTVTEITFGGVPATSFSLSSATSMWARVPYGGLSGPVRVYNALGSGESAVEFEVPISPAVTTIEPQSAAPGSTVRLFGRGLTGASQVRFEPSEPAAATVVSDGEIEVTVPEDAQDGPLVVYAPGGVVESPMQFFVIEGAGPAGGVQGGGAAPGPSARVAAADSVSGFSPASGTTGDIVTVSGSGFTGATSVRFGNLQAQSFSVVSDTELTVVVPAGAQTNAIRVYTPGAVAASATEFVVEGAAAPIVRTFSPTTGTGWVVIYGAYFTGLTEVSFGGVPASNITLYGDGWLRAYTPAGISTGPISVTTSAGTGTSADDFRVGVAPTLDSLSTSSGAPGSTVTVTGSGFLGVSSVTMGVAAVFRVLDDTTLEVDVPRGTGETVTLTLSTPSHSVSSDPFTVISGAAPEVGSFSPGVAFTNGYVQVYGSGFSGTTGVTVGGGTVADFTIQSDGRLQLRVPPGAVTGAIEVENAAGSSSSSAELVVPATPTVTGFSPGAAAEGEPVTVTGTGFTYATLVRFSSNRTASFYVLDDTELVAFVPAGAVDGPISVALPGVLANSPSSFKVGSSCPPTITGFSPDSGGANTYVTVDGSCFTGTTEVLFNGVPASYLQLYSDVRLRARVPEGAGTGPITVVNTLGIATSSEELTFIPEPTLSGFSPTGGPPGTEVTITGTGFATTEWVRLSSQDATITSVSDTELVVTIPSGVRSGTLSVSTEGGNVSTTTSFLVESVELPTVTSFNPSGGPQWTAVTVYGTGFTGLERVLFNGREALATSLTSDTRLIAYVPPGATTGPIQVENTLGVGASAESFEVIPPPEVFFFSPSSGPEGTVVTIEGSGFTDVTVVAIGSAHASFTVVDDGRITATVPPGATTGAIQVESANGDGVSALSFTVVADDLPTISSFSPGSGSAGTQVTVSGSGFTGVTSVRFGGLASSSVSVQSDTQLRAWVPEGAGSGPIAVTNAIGTAASASSFTVRPPSDSSGLTISPTSGTAGTLVTLSGASFSNVDEVSFWGMSVTDFTVSGDELTVAVPEGALSGVISYSGSTFWRSTGIHFRVVPDSAPTISSFSPAEGDPGTWVTLIGSGFTGLDRAFFGGVPTTGLTPVSDTEVRVMVPENAITGPITAENALGVGSSATDFIAGATPNLTGVSPTSGPAGTVVTLSGYGLRDVGGVELAGATASFTSVDESEVTFEVPLGAGSGLIEVYAHGSTIYAPVPFTVTATEAPAVTGFTPESGGAGEAVLVTGSGFTGVTGVDFNGAPVAGYTVYGDDRLVVEVPQGATTGPIQVTNGLGSASSVTSFTVDPAPVVSGFSPQSGTSGVEVTVTGSGLSGTSSVAFNGALASFTVDGDGQLTATVPAGAVSGPLTVTGPGGTTKTTDSFYVPSGSAPVLSDFGPRLVGSGAMVSISGANLSGTTAVQLGSAPATSFQVLSDGLLVAVVATHATTGPVSVTNDVGTATSIDYLTIRPAPTVSGFSPPSGPPGTEVTVTGSGFTTLERVALGEALGGLDVEFTVIDDASLTFVVPSGALPGRIRVIGPTGQAASATSFTAQGFLSPGVAIFTPTYGDVGSLVLIAGSGFTGTTEVQFNGVASPFVASVSGDAYLYATVPSGATTGPISVTNHLGTGVSATPFTLVSGEGPPTISAVTPASAARGERITLTGERLSPLTNLRFLGSAGAVEVVSSSSTEIELVVPPDAIDGQIYVSNAVGIAVASFTLVEPPSVTAVEPAFTPVDTATAVTLRGTGFTSGASVTFGGVPADSVTFVSSTELSVTAPASAVAGAVDVEVENPDGRAFVAGEGFTYYGALAAPTVTSLDPVEGPASGDTFVTLTGDELFDGAVVTVDGVEADEVVVLNPETLTFRTPALPAGPATVRVTHVDGQWAELVDAFTVIGPPAPAVATPSSGTTNGGTAVTLTGADFSSDATVTVGGRAALDVVFVGPTELSFTTPPGEPGAADVVVTHADGQSGTAAGAFTYVAAPAPTVASVSPGSGTEDGGTPLTVTGTGFVEGTQLWIDNTVPLSVTYVSPTELTATTRAHWPGAVDVRVGNPDGTYATLEGGFIYLDDPPSLLLVSPSNGPASGGVSVMVSGANLRVGASVTFDGVAATDVEVVGSTAVTCTLPALPPGAATVRVTNGDGQFAELVDAFTVVPPPTVDAVDPASGTSNGGTVVTVGGSGFAEGAVVVVGGEEALDVTWVDSTELAFTTPPHAGGAVDVIVRNPDQQTGTLTGGFTYVAASAPTVTSVDPSSGPGAGGTAVTVTGTGFVEGSTVLIGGVSAEPVTFVSATELTATTGAHAPGEVQVDVQNPDGSSGSLAAAYTYGPEPAPSVTALTPDHGPMTGGTTVTISGADFQAGAGVTFGGVAGTVSGVTATSITVVTPARGSIGPVDVVVTNPDAQTATELAGFTYDWGAAPTVASVTPDTGPASGGTELSISGTGFVDGATVTVGGVEATDVVVVDATSITAVTAARAAGTVAVVVTNTDAQSGTLSAAFTYEVEAAAPTVVSASPSVGPTAGGTNVTVSGTGFVDGATVRFGALGATSVTFIDSGTLTAVTPAQAAGSVDVVVTNPDAQSATLTDGFTYEAGPAPTVSAVNPDSGPATGGTSVTLTGTAFVDGAEVRFGGVDAASVTFGSPSSLTATTPAHAAGAVDVEVTNPDEQSVTVVGGFTYVASPPPEVTSVTPAEGPSVGGTSVAITGTGFVSGAEVRFGAVSSTSVVYGSATSLTATAPGQAPGTVDVTVTNPDAQAHSLTAAFTYQATESFTLEAVTPASGTTNGGTDVTLNGAGFAQGAQVTFGGTAATGVVVASSSSIAAKTPAHAAGSVDVVVVNPDDESVTLAGGFAYVQASAPSVASVQPDVGSLEGGELVTITGSGFAPGAVVRFGSTEATSATVNSPTSITARTPAMLAGSVTVTVTNPDGQQAALTEAFLFEAPAGGCGCSSGGEGLSMAMALLALIALRGGRRRRA